MLTGTHYSTLPVAEAHLVEDGWIEVAIGTWRNGDHVAEVRAVHAVVVEVTIAMVPQ